MSSLKPAQVTSIVAEVDTACAQYLTFTLQGEPYAVGILHVKEIIEFLEITEVPLMPDFVRGVINLRGSVVPVIDLLARFGKGATQVRPRTAIVIVEVANPVGEQETALQNIGIMVDAVNEVVEISQTDIEPPPPFGASLRTDFIAGMARRGSKFTVILDMSQTLSIAEMAALSEIPL